MSALRLAIPSSGTLAKPTLEYLKNCGIAIKRDNERVYTGSVPSIPGIEVLYQRQSDITRRIDEGSSDLGIVGLDAFQEMRLKSGHSRQVGEGLGFGGSRLVIAVPNSWADVTTVSDLADLSLEYREKGEELRIATKYERLVKEFLDDHEIYYVRLVRAAGALEVAPIMGYADLIADVTASGVTLRENHLRPLVDGTVVSSEAVMIANVKLLSESPEKMAATREILERIEASQRSRKYQRVSLNLTADSMEDAAAKVQGRNELAGIDGPSVSKVFSSSPGDWFNVQVVIPRSQTLKAVDYFRSLGGTSITVNDASYVFRKECESYNRLEQQVTEYRANSQDLA